MSEKRPKRHASFRHFREKEATAVTRRPKRSADNPGQEERRSMSLGDLASSGSPATPLAFMDELRRVLVSRSQVSLRAPAARTSVTRAKTFCEPPGQVGRADLPRLVMDAAVDRFKLQDGDKLARQWSCRAWGCLTEDARLFLGRAQSEVRAAASQPAAPRSTPLPGVFMVEVREALVRDTSSHSNKKHVLEVRRAGGRLLLLLQNDEEARSGRWLTALRRASTRSGYGSLDRTRCRQLPDVTTPVSDGVVRSILGRFFGGGRRPTREFLETRGIYRDEPVFGSRLSELCRDEGQQVPRFVRECIHALSSEPHVLQVGLYRTSGNLSRIQRLRLRVDQKDLQAVREEQDADVLAGALKMFFRELREPLLPYQTYVLLLRDVERDTAAVCGTLAALPPAHLATLAALCRHLAHVVVHETANQMSATSMAIVWGPSFTWPEETSADAIVHCTKINRVVEYLIENERRVLGGGA